MSADAVTNIAAEPTRSASTGRMAGLDLARGLAVLGMFAAHVGPVQGEDGPIGLAAQFAHGRASALFALLAGVSLTLIAGRSPRVGRAGRQAAARIALRALILLAVGSAMTAMHAPVDVILAYYGLYFLLALPLSRLPAGPLATAALGWALLGPQLSFVLRAGLDTRDWSEPLTALDPIAHLSGGEGLVALLLTGNYPALTWMPFVLGGMALGRLDLTSARLRSRLAATGAALIGLGYGGAWLACRLVATDVDWWHGAEEGTVNTADPAGLLTAAPHSGTTFEILGSLGVAVSIVVACTTLLARRPSVGTRLPVAPVAAVGALSLSVYVGHIVLIEALGGDDLPDSPAVLLAAFSALALALAWMWTRRFRRGPLEAALHRATLLARFVR
ncbi:MULTISPECIES: DUF418 domain-containing protein [Kitasatospora]|uniref:Heparan-alpha-glucosaminide N-acetyltransferase domain-containing protein n=1 Tax=Kitasatospora cystarginea TaxID=58350 RepID=A0ABN3ESP3_9ACTN